jgi:hypothetical protein
MIFQLIFLFFSFQKGIVTQDPDGSFLNETFRSPARNRTVFDFEYSKLGVNWDITQFLSANYSKSVSLEPTKIF